MEEETKEIAETMEKKENETIVVVNRGAGCLAQIISLIIVLILPEVVGYLVYNHQLNKAIQTRIEMNEWLVKNLRQVSDNIYDLTNLEITGNQPAKAFFVFSRKDQKGGVTTTTYELETEALSGGVFKIHTPATEYLIGLSPARWIYEKIITPQLPEYSFLLATPYSLEFCSGLGKCNLLKKTVGFSDENGKYSYFF